MSKYLELMDKKFGVTDEGDFYGVSTNLRRSSILDI